MINEKRRGIIFNIVLIFDFFTKCNALFYFKINFNLSSCGIIQFEKKMTDRNFDSQKSKNNTFSMHFYNLITFSGYQKFFTSI